MITIDTLLKLSRQLMDVAECDYVAAAAAEIRRLLPGDDVCWVQCDWDRNCFAVWRISRGGRDPQWEALLPTAYHDPAVQSYVRTPADLSPRRLSDVPARDQSEAAALRLSQQHLGRQQLSMIVNAQSPTVGSGWIVCREDDDFGDEEVEVATRVLPVLYLLDQFHQPDLTRVPAEAGPDLTARERQVIDLLTTGLTASAIGRMLGISQRTVSKHIQNAYDKLGIHDRLLVATRRRPAPHRTYAGSWA
ncbi:MAG: response regulator transcription factor [Microlunatus sp.]|nr:response regulator transcription factor [Microlunatus sp.]